MARLTEQHQRAIDLMAQAERATSESQANALISQAQAAAQQAGRNNATVFAAVTAHAQQIQSRLVAQRPKETGGGGGGPVVPPAPTYTPPPAAFSALQIMENVLQNALGVSGLGSWAAGLYNRGASPTEIIQALRYGTDQSPEGQAARAKYLDAFPRIDEFMRDGIFAGENPELQYIAYRNSVTEAAQRYGINANLVTKQKIADYIGNRVSASEIADRMSQAATAVATTPAETISVLRDYYGVQNGDLISFYLDPETTEAELQKRYTAARIGTEAFRQDFGIDVQLAENLAQRGVTPDEAARAFGTAQRQSPFMMGRGETISREGLIGAQFGDQQNIQQIERIAGSRVAEFQRGGGYVSTREGVGGLSSASAP